MGKVLAIQGVDILIEFVRCRAFRHAIDDDHGALFQEQRDGHTVWVFRGECPRCGTRRIDTMTPRSYQLVSRVYEHPDGYDGLLSPQEARAVLYRHKRKLALVA